MKNGNKYLLVALVLALGCSSENSEPVAKKDSVAIQQHDRQQEPPISDSGSESQVAVKKLTQSLESLTEQAKQLETDYKFQEAAELWSQVGEILREKFGQESWQFKNAQLSREFAVQASKLDSQQMNQLRLLQNNVANVAKFTAANQAEPALAAALRAHEYSTSLFGGQSAIVGRQWLQMGELQMEAGFKDGARHSFHKGVDVLKGLQIVNHPEVEKAHAALAAIYAQQKQFGPAVENQKEATKIAARIWGENSVDYALQANQLGVIFQRAGRLETALGVLQASEVIRRNELGKNSLPVAHSLLNIGIVQQGMRKYDDAYASYQRAEEILASHNESGSLLECRSNLATIQMLKGRYSDAEAVLESVLTSLNSNPKTTPVLLAKYQFRLAIAQAKQGKYDRAQPLLEQTLAIQKANLREGDGETIKTMKAYALVLEKTKQFAASKKIKQQIQLVAAGDDQSFQR